MGFGVELSDDVISGLTGPEAEDNITGLDYALECGCEPKLFVEVMDSMIKENRVKILGTYNKQATNIHKANIYKIELK